MLTALAFAIPLVWTGLTAFKGDLQLEQAPLSLWPDPWNYHNLQRALEVVPMHRYTFNTCWLACLNAAGHLISCPLAAYALIRLQGRWGSFWRGLTLVAFVVPYPAVMVPQYLLFQKLGWVNTPWPLVLPAFLGSPFFILYLMRVFRGLPRELEEAAILEGAGFVTLLHRVLLPLSLPSLAAMSVLTFQFVWNDFLGPLLYLQDPRFYTVNLGLQFYRGSYQVEWNLMMAAALLSILPMILLFLIAQRAFLSNALEGAGK